MKHSLEEILEDPFETKVQAYASNVIQVSHLLEWMTGKAGKNLKVWHTTFSISEEFLRSILVLRKKRDIESYKLIVDRKALSKVLNLDALIKSAVDECSLIDNHSKIIIVNGDRGAIAAVTSQNLTRGNRMEATMLTSDENVVNELVKIFGVG